MSTRRCATEAGFAVRRQAYLSSNGHISDTQQHVRFALAHLHLSVREASAAHITAVLAPRPSRVETRTTISMAGMINITASTSMEVTTMVKGASSTQAVVDTVKIAVSSR